MNFNWDDLFISLRQEKCLLFIGPELFSGAGGVSLEQQVCKFLDATNPAHPHILSYLEDDGFFLFRKKKYRTVIIEQLTNFYASQEFPDTLALYAQIARIPFSILVSLTPDLLLPQVFNQLGLEYHHDYYHRHEEPRHYLMPNKEKPLIYNILGCFEAQGSMVLTHADLFEYMESVMQGGRMDTKLRDAFLTAQQYIFIGLPFNKWYMQILLRMLKIHDIPDDLERFAIQPVLTFRREYYESEFKIEFIEQSPAQFIRTLYTQCEQRDLLRPVGSLPTQSASLDFDALRALIGQGLYLESLCALKNWLAVHRPSTIRLFDSSVVLENRYLLTDAEYRAGRIDFRDYELRLNNLHPELLQLLAASEKRIT